MLSPHGEGEGLPSVGVFSVRVQQGPNLSVLSLAGMSCSRRPGDKAYLSLSGTGRPSSSGWRYPFLSPGAECGVVGVWSALDPALTLPVPSSGWGCQPGTWLRAGPT